jgi:hypothetical protein
MKVLFAASIVTAALAIGPASAAMMACTSANIAKSVAGVDTMPDGPRKMAMIRDASLANAAMSKGDMRAACKIYIRAQR